MEFIIYTKGNIFHLSDDLLFHIMEFFAAQDCVSIAQVSTRFKFLLDTSDANERLWKPTCIAFVGLYTANVSNCSLLERLSKVRVKHIKRQLNLKRIDTSTCIEIEEVLFHLFVITISLTPYFLKVSGAARRLASIRISITRSNIVHKICTLLRVGT